MPIWNQRARELTGWRSKNAWVQGHYLPTDSNDPAWYYHIQDVLEGCVRNYWTDIRRTSWLPSRFLIKEIRMNLMLGFIARHFQPTIIFLIRHPCAVISSRIRCGWQANVGGILLQEQLVEDYLQPWTADLRKVADPIGHHAAWWAVENLVGLSELRAYPHQFIVYEDLVTDPVFSLKTLFQAINLPPPQFSADKLTKPSRMGRQRNIRDSWCHHLSTSDIEKIRAWNDRIELQQLLPESCKKWDFSLVC